MHDRPPEVSFIAERLESARAGSRSALGDALDACRNYLLLVANQQLDSDLRGKAGFRARPPRRRAGPGHPTAGSA
jgi:hypothetical protein